MAAVTVPFFPGYGFSRRAVSDMLLSTNTEGSSKEPPLKAQATKLEKHGCLFVSWERGRRGISERPGSKVPSGTELQSMRTLLLTFFTPALPPPPRCNPTIFGAVNRILDQTIPERGWERWGQEDPSDTSKQWRFIGVYPDVSFKSYPPPTTRVISIPHTTVPTRSACGHGKARLSQGFRQHGSPGEWQGQVWAAR